MAPDVFVLMSIGSVSFIASYLTLLAQAPIEEEPEEVGPEVIYWLPPPLPMRQRRAAPPVARTLSLALPRVLLELGEDGWQVSVEPLCDVPAQAVSMSSGAPIHVQDLRWSGAVGLPRRPAPAPGEARQGLTRRACIRPRRRLCSGAWRATLSSGPRRCSPPPPAP